MKLSQHDKKTLRCWKEGECYNNEPDPMLPRVISRVISKLVAQRKSRTSKGFLTAVEDALAVVRGEMEVIRQERSAASGQGQG